MPTTFVPIAPTEDRLTDTSFANNFWSFDQAGVKNLMGHMRTAYNDLGSIQTVYNERAQLEKEFGEKLMALSDKVSGSLKSEDEEEEGTKGALGALHMELGKTAKSHMDLSRRLKEQVAAALDEWLTDKRKSLDKWSTTLDSMYRNRQSKIETLLQARERCQREYRLNDGKMTPQLRRYENDYHALLKTVESIVAEWNSTWTEACNEMERLELERVEFFTTNVWDYANLASARLLVQDEWCETIRKRLEGCNSDEELERCVKRLRTGSEVPDAPSYINHCLKQRVPEPVEPPSTGTMRVSNKTLPPRPGTVSAATGKPPVLPSRGGPADTSRFGTSQVKRKPLGNGMPEKSFADKYHTSKAASRPQDASKQEAAGSLEELLKKFEDTNMSNRAGQQQQQAQHSAESYGNTSYEPIPSTRHNHQKPPRPEASVSTGTINRRPQDSPPATLNHRPPMTTSCSSSDTAQSSRPRTPQQASYSPPASHDPSRYGTLTMSQGASVQPPKSPRPVSQQLQQGTLTHNAANQYFQHTRSMSTPPTSLAQSAPRSPMMGQQQAYAPPSPLMLPHVQATAQSIPTTNAGAPGWGAVQPQSTAPTSPYMTYQQPAPMSRPPQSPQPQYQQPQTGSYGYTAPLGGHSPALGAQQPYDAGRPVSPMMLHSPMLSSHSPIPSPRMEPSIAMQQLPSGHTWCQAKFDRYGDDESELSFRKGNFFAISERRPDGWWVATVWDEVQQRFGATGQIPSNFVDLL